MQFYHSQWEIRNDSAHSTASVGRGSDVGRDSDSATTLAEKDSAALPLAQVPVAQVPGTRIVKWSSWAGDQLTVPRFVGEPTVACAPAG